MGKQTSLVPTQTLEQHSSNIQIAMHKSIEGFIEVGRKIMEARVELAEEDFDLLFDKDSQYYVGMAQRQGYRFLAIAKNGDKLLKYKDNIPADVTQLDAISRMSEKDIKAAIKDEVLSSSMNRGELSRWEKKRNEVHDPNQLEIKLPVREESVVQDAVVVEEEEESELRKATRIVLEDTPEGDRLLVIKGFMKKWKISIDEL